MGVPLFGGLCGADAPLRLHHPTGGAYVERRRQRDDDRLAPSGGNSSSVCRRCVLAIPSGPSSESRGAAQVAARAHRATWCGPHHKPRPQTQKSPHEAGFFGFFVLAMTYFPRVKTPVSSARLDLTSVFGMGTGVPPTIRLPKRCVNRFGGDRRDRFIESKSNSCNHEPYAKCG